jgi:hypothetical protein
MRKRIRPLIRTLVERAQAQGTLRPDFTLDDISFVFQAVGRGIENDAASRHAWRRQLSFFFEGLRTRV